MSELVQNKRPDQIDVKELDKPTELGLIPAWSHSALKTYEACSYRSYIAKVKKYKKTLDQQLRVVLIYIYKQKTMLKENSLNFLIPLKNLNLNSKSSKLFLQMQKLNLKVNGVLQLIGNPVVGWLLKYGVESN